MRALLGSGGIGTEERRQMYRDLMAENFSECQKVIFVPFASNDYDGYTARMREFAGEAGYEMVGLHECDNPLAAVQEMEGIYVGGGNTWLLVSKLHELGLIEAVREAVLERGVPYAGVSAGANVACPEYADYQRYGSHYGTLIRDLRSCTVPNQSTLSSGRNLVSRERGWRIHPALRRDQSKKGEGVPRDKRHPRDWHV